MSKNLLKNSSGDPYALADVVDAYVGRVPFAMDATFFNAGGNKYLPAVKGRVRELVVIVQVALSANASVVSVSVGTETLGSVTIPASAPAGTRLSVVINDDVDNFNQVEDGEVVIVNADGAPSTGEITGFVRISAAEQA